MADRPLASTSAPGNNKLPICLPADGGIFRKFMESGTERSLLKGKNSLKIVFSSQAFSRNFLKFSGKHTQPAFTDLVTGWKTHLPFSPSLPHPFVLKTHICFHDRSMYPLDGSSSVQANFNSIRSGRFPNRC